MTEKRVALIIATDKYEDKDLRQLISPAHDAEALAGVLKEPDIGGFEVKTLLNETSHRIRREIEAFFIDRTRDDLLLLYFSCHGIKDEDGRLYYSTTDTDRKLLRATAIESGFVNDIMQRSRSRRQVLLLDCCYSGAFARGMITKADKKVITRNDFEGEGRGRVVLTASDAMQYSFEGDQVGGKGIPSVFTGNLVHGLKTGEADRDADGHITIDELYDYVHDRVVDATPEQRPAKWNFGVQGRIVIARNPNPVIKPVELPSELMQSIQDLRHWVREGAVRELERILNGTHKGLALSAQEALKGMLNDDSERVRKEVTRVMGTYTKIQPGSITVQEKTPVVESGITTPTPVVETEHPQPAEKDEKETIEKQPPPELEEISTAISTNITGQEKPAVVESEITPVVETETPQPEKKAEKKTIIQQPPRVSEESSTVISKRKSILLWLLPAILVPVISGIVVSVIFFSNGQHIVPSPIVETPKNIEETSEQLEKVEKFPASEIKEIKFRSEPIEKFFKESVKSMLRRYNFYCKEYDWNKEFSNPQGSGFQNNFEPQINGGDRVILDHASGLMWQQSGSDKDMKYGEAEEYIDQLNRDQFAGYSDWRLPTLEEAMSLMERTKNKDGLYIDPLFDKRQWGIWTSDTYSASSVWVVMFNIGDCSRDDLYFYVRAVR